MRKIYLEEGQSHRPDGKKAAWAVQSKIRQKLD